MYVSETKVRVRYGETDQMGYAYYGNYATYFEVARVEAMRALGIRYKDLEEAGCMMPVLEFTVKYFKPAFYDEELLIKTTIAAMPTSRILFTYEVFNEKGEQLNAASTTLVFISTATNRPCRIPEMLAAPLSKYFEI